MNELIKVEQLPIIKAQFESIRESIVTKTDAIKNLAVTPESKVAAKKIRADLNAEFNEFEALRKEVKAQVYNPYLDFERTYKEIVTEPYKAADNALKVKISEIEDAEKKDKESKIRVYYTECVASKQCQFLTQYHRFDKLGIKVTLTGSLKSYCDMVAKGVDDAFNGYRQICEYCTDPAVRDDTLIAYSKSFNAMEALCFAKKREEELKAIAEAMQADNAHEEQEKIVEEEQTQFLTRPVEETPQKAEAPVEVSEETLYSMTFTVTGTIEQLKAVKNFIIERGIQYE